MGDVTAGTVIRQSPPIVQGGGASQGAEPHHAPLLPALRPASSMPLRVTRRRLVMVSRYIAKVAAV